METRSKIARGRVSLRRPTSHLRALPAFLVIGTMRGGTSSLYQYLAAHPQVVPPLRKEVEFFSRFHDRGVDWYQQHFPMRSRLLAMRSLGGAGVTFEATPYYLFHPHAAERAFRLLPEARIVVLLRDPVSRARSHHQHMSRLALEMLPFEDAVAEEPARTATEWQRMVQDPTYDSLAVHRYSYLARGQYADQLERWLGFYTTSRMLILESADLYAAPAETFTRITEFLGLRPWQPPQFDNHSLAPQTPRATRTEEDRALAARFAEDASRLTSLLGRTPSWVVDPSGER